MAQETIKNPCWRYSGRLCRNIVRLIMMMMTSEVVVHVDVWGNKGWLAVCRQHCVLLIVKTHEYFKSSSSSSGISGEGKCKPPGPEIMD